VVGGAAGQHKGGRHLKYPDHTPMNQPPLTMLDKVGIPMDARRQHRGAQGLTGQVGRVGQVWSGGAVLLGLAKKERRGSLVTKSIGGSWLVPLIVVGLLYVPAVRLGADTNIRSSARESREGWRQSRRGDAAQAARERQCTRSRRTTALHWAVRQDDPRARRSAASRRADLRIANRYGHHRACIWPASTAAPPSSSAW